MKKLYRIFVRLLYDFLLLIHIKKTSLAEWVAILKKRNFYSSVKLSPCQMEEFDSYWQENYGKKISPRWHKLYATINGRYRKDYLPDVIFSAQLEPKLNPMRYAMLYSDKSMAEVIYAGVDNVSFPETLVVKANGFFYSLGRKIISKNEAREILLNEPVCVVKPLIGGSSGDGVLFFDKSKLSNDVYDEEIGRILDNYEDIGFIAQKKLNQHESYSILCDSSVNTIRLITYICEGVIHHARLCLRVGDGESKVDNIHAGGFVAAVTDDGVIVSEGYRLGYTDRKEVFENHPVSGARFKGHILQGTSDMISAAKLLHANTPHIGMVSWDFMLDSSGRVVLVEGNYFGQAVWFAQIVHCAPIFGENSIKMLKSLA